MAVNSYGAAQGRRAYALRPVDTIVEPSLEYPLWDRLFSRSITRITCI